MDKIIFGITYNSFSFTFFNFSGVKAKEAIAEAEQSDPESPVIYFYKFKIALMEGEDDIG